MLHHSPRTARQAVDFREGRPAHVPTAPERRTALDSDLETCEFSHKIPSKNPASLPI
jgi:hypothetical protein